METTVECKDPFAAESYKKLFEDIMADIGKSVMIEKTMLLLDPHVPLFVFSIKLLATPTSKKIGDISNVREEGSAVHITITDERYAPEILNQLWKKYGRGSVDQQTRFDMTVNGAKAKEISDTVISSGEESLKEIVGALWRIMPEGIKNRHTYIEGPVVTVVATEEKFNPEMLEEGYKIHRAMGGVADV